MNIIVIIQARMGSTRLPGKVLMDLSGKTLLERVIERTKQAQKLSSVIVATTANPQDREISRLCHDLKIPFTCGSELDVLDRYYQTAIRHGADVVVRITGDCPLIDPGIIDDVISTFLALPRIDYVSNTFSKRTFPRGLDVEAIRFKALEEAWIRDNNPLSREHVTPYIYRHPEFFSIYGYWHTDDLSKYRWTVDTKEDYDFIKLIYNHFGDDDFTWLDVISVLIQNPTWVHVNANIRQKQI